MAGGNGAAKSSKPTRIRKRVEVEKDDVPAAASASASLKRAKDGSAFAKCDECGKDVAVALISMHNCSLDAQIKMNLEAQVIEKPTEIKKKPVEKKKPKTTEPKVKKGKQSKNPNAPKRPPTAFFIFMDDFRKSFKEQNPDNKSVSVVAKEGGEKWKSMTEEEKQPYVEKAAELKAEYTKALESQNDSTEVENDEEVEKEIKEEDVADEEAEKKTKEEDAADEDE
ncbi:OLC1v1033375C1 [Oldenlandia corymbosa var. corymbosa]|uniref:OLC1v1033375C1 n=1 Tax=Oldenlandia corymbosa var. corymbosa TaxID=529605 RepID=A0AAV1CPL9_OLDCO|nr:OLC1v1033375C1 [Oldenlandia corymbosa var. corymbosa]